MISSFAQLSFILLCFTATIYRITFSSSTDSMKAQDYDSYEMHYLLSHTFLYERPTSSFSPSPKPICHINPNPNAKPMPNPNPIPNPNPNPNPIPIPTLIIKLILTIIAMLVLTLTLSLNRNLLIYQSCGLCAKLNATEIIFNP